MRKQYLFIILIALLLCFIVCAFAENTIEPAPASDFIYVDNGSEVQINGYQGRGGVVRIPDTIDEMPVTRMAPNAFKGNESITGVVFPMNLTVIPEHAFEQCTSLSEIVFPDNLKCIEYCAFAYTNLHGVIILPHTLQTLECNAFMLCDKITGIVINSDCDIESYGLVNIYNLEFLYIAEGSKGTIGDNITNSSVLTEAIIPKDVKINGDAFPGANQLTIYTPAGSDAEKYAKANFIQVNTEDYEEKKAEYEKLYGTDSEGYMKSVPDSKPRSADEQTTELSTTVIQSGDTRVSGLYTYNIKGNGTVSIVDYDWDKSSGDIYIPSMLDGYTVTTIGEEAFAYGKEKNKEDVLIAIPDSINMIGEKAFYNYPVSTINIPSSVQSIGKAAFAYCDITQFIVDQKQPNYTTVDGVLYDKRNKALLAHPQKKTISSKIPEGILSISEYAFSGMMIGDKDSASLCFTDILPSTLTKIEPHAFENCTLYYSLNNAESGITNSNGTDHYIALLPRGLSEIGEYAFAGCVFKCNNDSTPDKIVLADKLNEIGDYAFSDCKFYDGFEYELIVSQSEMNRIGKYAFSSSAMSLKDNERMKVRIVLPDTVDEIGESAFFETHSVCLKEGTEIRTLGAAAFQNTIVYTDVKKETDQDVIPISLSIFGKIKKIPSLAFAYNSDDDLNTVETICIQEGITTIEESAFAGRKSLQSVMLPMTLTEINANVFLGCQKLLEVKIPESVMKIGNNAFERQFVTLIVKENSYAALWASENGYNYRFDENTDSLDWLNSDIH